MKELKCPKCSLNDLSDYGGKHYLYDRLDMKKGQSTITRLVQCDWCSHVFEVRIEMEIVNVEINE